MNRQLSSHYLVIAILAAAIVANLSPANGVAQSASIASDTRPRPGDPVTGWSGNFSSTDPYSAGPGKGAWITKAGLIHSRSEVAMGEVNALLDPPHWAILVLE